MPTPLLTVHVDPADYPSPAVGDREHDEELGPIVVTSVEPEDDGWLVTFGQVREPHLLCDDLTLGAASLRDRAP